MPSRITKSYSVTDPKIADYVFETFQPDDEVLAEARRSTNANNIPPIQVGVFDGLHLEVLTRAFGAKKILEIGTLVGYSAICMARGLPQDGVIHTLDFQELHIDIARKNIENAGYINQVRFHQGLALNVLPTLEKEGPFDLIFIDADKVNYPHYAKWAEENLRVGGVILGDNTFAFGYITGEKQPDDETKHAVRGIREFNEYLARSPRFRSTLLPTGEGLTVAVKTK